MTTTTGLFQSIHHNHQNDKTIHQTDHYYPVKDASGSAPNNDDKKQNALCAKQNDEIDRRNNAYFEKLSDRSESKVQQIEPEQRLGSGQPARQHQHLQHLLQHRERQ